MIKFFRQIRYRLMETGNTSKYFKYAIGEILLVVIGILIALQINNWNQKRISSNREAVILKSLNSELKNNLRELQIDYVNNLQFYQSTVYVYQYINKKPPETDSMYNDFNSIVGFDYFFPKTSTYETLKSGNLEIIRSDSLKEIITSVYESGFKRIINKIETRRNAARLLFPYHQKHFRSTFKVNLDTVDLLKNRNDLKLFKKISIPNDYSTLINDPEFESLVTEAINGRRNIIRDYERTIQNVKTCIEFINSYLAN
ncbi:MAG: hypothetical protein HKN00_11210 [Flavobacteriaceae bacterium]|nr:hypothetical protein [Bacteroidia bacterium]NNF75746.1 hypothetical protein [Flavobacteriaceae bacterium]